MRSRTATRRAYLASILRWFDARWRAPGMWAFALNRLAALGLTLYLFLHLIVLSQLARGPQAYAQFLATIRSPLFVFGEFLVVVAGLYHGLNGLRIALTSFGIATRYQKQLFAGLLLITLASSLYFAWHMFSG